jgi:hypothetical protein
MKHRFSKYLFKHGQSNWNQSFPHAPTSNYQLPMLKGCQMVLYVLALPFTAGANKIMKNGKNVTWPGNFNAR